MNDEQEPLDLEAWPTREPTAGFADRVMSRVAVEAPPKRKLPVRRIAAVGGGMALAAAIVLKLASPPSHGSFIAKDRTEVAIGNRALAVLEPGASVSWNGDDVEQPKGDVFYRVEPGAKFTVHTPAGDVEVKGTCFGVKVSSEDYMQKRDMKSGAIGAALSALAFVAVYEGKVSVSHASTHVDLKAGESAAMSPDGVTKRGGGTDAERQLEADLAAKANDADDPAMSANKNLVRQVGEYRGRLEAIAQEKSALETKLSKTETALQAAQDGAPVVMKNDFDVSPDDWKEMAKDGSIKYQSPCINVDKPWTPSADRLNQLGLAPDDGPVIRDAYQRSSQQLWSQIRPLCASAIGSETAADKIGPDTCIQVVLSNAENADPQGAEAARKLVGQIRSGQAPMPGPNDSVSPVERIFLVMTGSSGALESDLAKSFGPEEAHRLAFSDKLCMGQHSHNYSPKK